MYYCSNYALAVAFCVVTMFCWGSWGNTQKLAGKTWRYELFYWDYVIGVVLFALASGFTAGSWGGGEWSFITNLKQASAANLGSAFLGGIVFNAANILLAAAISIAGMSVAFPVGIGLALVLGVIINYVSNGNGNPVLLFLGVAIIVVAILCNAFAYKIKQASELSGQRSNGLVKGIVLSVICGVLMSTFYYFVGRTMPEKFKDFAATAPKAGLLTPYAAFFVFTCGVFASTFVFNAIAMRHPVSGEPINEKAYFKGGFPVHLVGVLGGLIWGLGFGINLVAAGKAGTAISYGLGQGATLVSALWGILVWREFKGAPKKAGFLNLAMFVLFLIGLGLIIAAGQATPLVGSEKKMLIHSHNDYAQKRPFWGAYEAGADSIEADVFLLDGELLVAHSRKELKKENTLRRLYLEPLREVMRKNGGRAYADGKPLQLLVDLKNGKPVLDRLVEMIEKEGYRDCFDIMKNPSVVRLTITGDHSKITDFFAYPDYVFFDVPPIRKLADEQYKRVPLISHYARAYTSWRSGEMSEADKEKIRVAVSEAHAKGCKFRLWGYPDNPEAWRLARELGLDYINTDRPAAAAAFQRNH